MEICFWRVHLIPESILSAVNFNTKWLNFRPKVSVIFNWTPVELNTLILKYFWGCPKEFSTALLNRASNHIEKTANLEQKLIGKYTAVCL